MSDSLGEGFRQVYERLKMEFYREVFCASTTWTPRSRPWRPSRWRS